MALYTPCIACKSPIKIEQTALGAEGNCAVCSHTQILVPESGRVLLEVLHQTHADYCKALMTVGESVGLEYRFSMSVEVGALFLFHFDLALFKFRQEERIRDVLFRLGKEVVILFDDEEVNAAVNHRLGCYAELLRLKGMPRGFDAVRKTFLNYIIASPRATTDMPACDIPLRIVGFEIGATMETVVLTLEEKLVLPLCAAFRNVLSLSQNVLELDSSIVSAGIDGAFEES